MTSTPAPPPSTKHRVHPVLFAISGPELGAVFALHGSSAWLGRSPGLPVSLNDDAISQRHARITRHRDGGCYLEDGQSLNGTYVNDQRVDTPRRLADGDHIRLGNTTLRFSMLDELEQNALLSLYELTVRDPLTHAFNRRHLVPHLNSELAFATRRHMSVAVLLVDIDHFKSVNDRFGHAMGDVVLQLVASTIQRLLRPYDSLFRYGGEEFLVVVRDTSLRNAEILAERIRHHVEELQFESQGALHAVTVSIGVTLAPPDSGPADVAALIQTADLAMYQAKSAGRNRVHARPSLVPSSTPPSRAATLPPAAEAAPARPTEPLLRLH
ncbi:MAG TPA: GGDEF domain-containing protein [Polyangiaceae bacterium]|nr:GGDEF domain-containing protein [Polyangiaceae bacterium]